MLICRPFAYDIGPLGLSHIFFKKCKNKTGKTQACKLLLLDIQMGSFQDLPLLCRSSALHVILKNTNNHHHSKTFLQTPKETSRLIIRKSKMIHTKHTGDRLGDFVKYLIEEKLTFKQKLN